MTNPNTSFENWMVGRPHEEASYHEFETWIDYSINPNTLSPEAQQFLVEGAVYLQQHNQRGRQRLSRWLIKYGITTPDYIAQAAGKDPNDLFTDSGKGVSLAQRFFGLGRRNDEEE